MSSYLYLYIYSHGYECMYTCTHMCTRVYVCTLYWVDTHIPVVFTAFPSILSPLSLSSFSRLSPFHLLLENSTSRNIIIRIVEGDVI